MNVRVGSSRWVRFVTFYFLLQRKQIFPLCSEYFYEDSHTQARVAIGQHPRSYFESCTAADPSPARVSLQTPSLCSSLSWDTQWAGRATNHTLQQVHRKCNHQLSSATVRGEAAADGSSWHRVGTEQRSGSLWSMRDFLPHWCRICSVTVQETPLSGGATANKAVTLLTVLTLFWKCLPPNFHVFTGIK